MESVVFRLRSEKVDHNKRKTKVIEAVDTNGRHLDAFLKRCLKCDVQPNIEIKLATIVGWKQFIAITSKKPN